MFLEKNRDKTDKKKRKTIVVLTDKKSEGRGRLKTKPQNLEVI